MSNCSGSKLLQHKPLSIHVPEGNYKFPLFSLQYFSPPVPCSPLSCPPPPHAYTYTIFTTVSVPLFFPPPSARRLHCRLFFTHLLIPRGQTFHRLRLSSLTTVLYSNLLLKPASESLASHTLQEKQDPVVLKEFGHANST